MSQEMYRNYRNMVVWGPFGNISDSDLNRVERKIRHQLPPAYCEFLKIANGGRLSYSVSLPPGEAGSPISFEDLVSVEKLVERWKTHKKQAKMTGLPTGLLPVADDGAGSELYLDLRPESYGQVLAFVHALPEWAGGGQDSFGIVAATWDDYLSQLTIDEDIAEMTWEEVSDDNDSLEDRAWREAVIVWLDAGLPDWRQRAWAD